MLKKRYSIDLAGHMAQCEANYARVMQLLPDMEQRDCLTFGIAVPNRDVPNEEGAGKPSPGFQLQVKERCKYTTMLDIYQIAAASEAASPAPWQPSLATPFFSLRVYHDAQMAEVIACHQHRLFRVSYDYPNEKMHQRDEKAQLNRFLGEWLSHALQYGHSLDDPMTVSL